MDTNLELNNINTAIKNLSPAVQKYLHEEFLEQITGSKGKIQESLITQFKEVLQNFYKIKF